MIGNALPDPYHRAAADRQHDALFTHDTVPRKLLPHLA